MTRHLTLKKICFLFLEMRQLQGDISKCSNLHYLIGKAKARFHLAKSPISKRVPEEHPYKPKHASFCPKTSSVEYLCEARSSNDEKKIGS